MASGHAVWRQLSCNLLGVATCLGPPPRNLPSHPPADPCSLEDVLRKQAAELERQSREWVAREAEVSAGRSRSAGAAAGTAAELAVAQGKVEAAAKRVRALEGENGELRRQRAQGAADQRMLEELLGDSEAERRWGRSREAGGCTLGCWFGIELGRR